MSRYPPTLASQLPDEYRPYGEQLNEGAMSTFGENGAVFKYANDDGALIGPFPALIASKEIGAKLVGMLNAFDTIPSIPLDAKETAILIIGARFDAKYEQYAHRNVATKVAGLSEEQVSAIKAQKKPEGLSEAANVAHDAAYHLANERGPLPQGLYDAAVKVLGKEGMLVLTHWVGIYSCFCILMNAADVPVPDGET